MYTFYQNRSRMCHFVPVSAEARKRKPEADPYFATFSSKNFAISARASLVSGNWK